MVLGRERSLAGDGLEQAGTHREDVDAGVSRGALEQLWRHVAQLALDLAALRGLAVRARVAPVQGLQALAWRLDQLADVREFLALAA